MDCQSRRPGCPQATGQNLRFWPEEIGRVKYDVIDDEETIDAFFRLARLEGIIPAIESAHAVAYGMKLAKTMGHGSVLINLSGRGDKDMDYVIEHYGIR